MGGEGDFGLVLRIPAWCEGDRAVEVNGEAADVPLSPGSYAEVRRIWRPGDTVRLSLPMPVRRVECHPRVAQNEGRVALSRGPLLYCFEEADRRPRPLRPLRSRTPRRRGRADRPGRGRRPRYLLGRPPLPHGASPSGRAPGRRCRGGNGRALLCVGEPRARGDARLAEEPLTRKRQKVNNPPTFDRKPKAHPTRIRGITARGGGG